MLTITEDYRKMQQKLHENPNYGVASISFAPLVAKVIEAYKVSNPAKYEIKKEALEAQLKELN